MDKVLDAIILYNAIHPIMHGETVHVWSRLVEEVRADTGRRYRRLWHQRALARAPETLLVRRMTKGFHPRSRSFRRQRTCYTRRCLPGASCAPLHTVATPTVALQFPHGSLETSAGTIKSRIVFLLTIIIQFIGEANFYVVYVDTTSSSADWWYINSQNTSKEIGLCGSHQFAWRTF